jgi:DNA modification methylase
MSYAGERGIPSDILHYRGFKGSQLDNLYSHWIWRQYASSFWDDIRMSNLLDSTESQDEEDEKHIHPLQKDVIQRVVEMRSNPGETVLTPFMGIGSEVYVPVQLGRRGLGIELKTSYYNQAVKNLANMPAEIGHETNLLDLMEAETE